MSSLKEEWASLMKLRESGYVDQAKKQEIKSRIFNNFYSLKQNTPVEVPNFSQISIKADYEKLRSNFLETISTEYRPKTPEIPKKFEFGLKNVTLPPSQHKLNRPDLKSKEIWAIVDSSLPDSANEIVPDQFVKHSIAEINSGFIKPLGFNKELNIFADISPVSRYLTMISSEDEEKYLKETSRHESNLFSLLHIVNESPLENDLERLEWSNTRKIVTGIVFRSEIKEALQTKAPEKNTTIESVHKLAISQCLSEPPFLLDSSLKTPNLKNSSSTAPLMQTINDLSILEKDLLDMMDEIKAEKHNTSFSKLKQLLDKTSNRLQSEKETGSSMHIRVLYQFLYEYLKTNENKLKSTEPKRQVQPKPTQKKTVTPIRTKKIVKVESTSSINSSRSSKWIGGSKFQADFEDEGDWVSANPEKKKKETRHDTLYKLSMKAKK